MYISKVSLVNYRNFKNVCFKFNKGINTIIGENASGKTNLFRAIRLLLDDNFIKYAYKLNEDDFNRSLGNWRGHWIIISIEFNEIDSSEEFQSLFIHSSAMMETKAVDRASYNLFLRPKVDIRNKLSELKEGDKDGFNAIIKNISIEENYEVVFYGRSTVNFNDPEIYKNIVGDFEKIIFPSDISHYEIGTKIPHQLSISKVISFTFIEALRDVISDFHNNKTNPLLTLLKNKSGSIDANIYEPITKLIEDVNKNIEDLNEVKTIRDDIKMTLQKALGRTYSPSSLSIKSSIPNEAEKLLQSLKLFIGESGEDYEGGIHNLSLGGANLIFLTLKLLEFRYKSSNNAFANFLIIEEPEAHIHNHIQKTLFEKLNYDDTQIIYSTHSTQISEVSNIKNMNIISKKLNHALVFQPSNELSEENITAVSRYLDAIRTNILFAKAVILVEGDAEQILIPVMIKQVLGVSIDELGITIVNIGSTGFENLAQIFHSNRIQKRCAIITDLDSAICDTTIINSDCEKTKNYKNKVSKSQKSGLERQEKLEKFVNNNEWIKVFYAKHTFEVDFLIAGNQEIIEKSIKNVYTNESTKNDARNDINNNDVAISGKRILTMAKNDGKGWYAIFLTKYITQSTVIPEYILNALKFCGVFDSPEIISDIRTYADSRFNEILDKLLDESPNNELSEEQLIEELSNP